MSVPVYCPHCGALFSSRAFHFGGNVRNLRLEGNRETCVNCGQLANIVDGTFDISEGVLSLISGPQFTRDVLKAFAELVQRAVNREITPAELQEQAEAIDPELGRAVSKVRASSPYALAILVMIMLTLKNCNFNIDAKVDVNKLWDQWTAAAQEEVYVPPSSNRKMKKSK
jgi:hypothetical protein